MLFRIGFGPENAAHFDTESGHTSDMVKNALRIRNTGKGFLLPLSRSHMRQEIIDLRAQIGGLVRQLAGG